jgi:hypothetical protein
MRGRSLLRGKQARGQRRRVRLRIVQFESLVSTVDVLASVAGRWSIGISIAVRRACDLPGLRTASGSTWRSSLSRCVAWRRRQGGRRCGDPAWLGAPGAGCSAIRTVRAFACSCVGVRRSVPTDVRVSRPGIVSSAVSEAGAPPATCASVRGSSEPLGRPATSCAAPRHAWPQAARARRIRPSSGLVTGARRELATSPEALPPLGHDEDMRGGKNSFVPRGGTPS